MATKKQKEELMQTLKFTPIRARILIQGYGGECYIGSVPREMYEFFKSKQIDIAQYASNWDDDMFSDVPEDMRPFSPGSPYDCDNLFHASGATMDDSSRLTVINDDTDEDIFEIKVSRWAAEKISKVLILNQVQWCSGADRARKAVSLTARSPSAHHLILPNCVSLMATAMTGISAPVWSTMVKK
jgi:hypothetical protein